MIMTIPAHKIRHEILKSARKHEINEEYGRVFGEEQLEKIAKDLSISDYQEINIEFKKLHNEGWIQGTNVMGLGTDRLKLVGVSLSIAATDWLETISNT